ncbi:uncharacterized protein LOC114357069 isoform X2 [Ostrinia furnacalis]|uniref:uncharacterized protein LOC114357069 isoform X2 n=1 Tax=Ostrinia furnacalis TaxID=93504 RepID=UPI001040A9CC|nr:uncharacterized protein LOC114357069 isoform X2 [Ostrinia furnacalis]
MRWCVLLLCALKFATGQNCRGDEPRNRDCENLCDKNGKNCRINAAVLLPQNSSFLANLPSVRPVFDLALADDVIKNAFPPDLYVNLTTYDVTDCDAAYAVISAIDAYNDCAHVFFGPSCDFALASVARITKFLGSTGTPLITTGGFTFDFVKQKQTCLDEFYMMVRAGPVGFKDLAYFLIDLFRQFDWTRAALLFDTPAFEAEVGGNGGHLLASTIHLYMISEGITVFGKELVASQPHEEMLLQDVGNNFASEFYLR